jgi:hypothetical protein
MLTLDTIARRLNQLELNRRQRRTDELPIVERLRHNPAAIMTSPDPWQTKLLTARWTRALLLCSRQSGKSTVAGALGLRTALLEPNSLILLLSPTQRQSGALFRDKVKRLYHDLGQPMALKQESALTLELVNGSRIVSLPGDESTIRGYSGVSLLIVDEAARVSDSLYLSIRPMLAVSRGRLICLSTPWGRRGFFFEAWMGNENWERVCIKAEDCPRIGKDFLAEEREALGDRWYRQEYQCSFEDVIGALLSKECIEASLSDDVKPLFGGN